MFGCLVSLVYVTGCLIVICFCLCLCFAIVGSLIAVWHMVVFAFVNVGIAGVRLLWCLSLLLLFDVCV